MDVLMNIFTMLFATMGPIKVLIVFAEKARHLSGGVRRRIAVKAVVVATVVGLLFIFFGGLLMKLFKFSLPALVIAGGLILLVFSVRMVLSEEDYEEPEYSGREAEKMAIYPLAMPLMVSPMGIVVLTMVSASKSVADEDIASLVIIFAAIMLINLVALLLEDTIMQSIPPELLQVAHRLLGILLAALAVQVLVNGLAALGVIALEEVGSMRGLF